MYSQQLLTKSNINQLRVWHTDIYQIDEGRELIGKRKKKNLVQSEMDDLMGRNAYLMRWFRLDCLVARYTEEESSVCGGFVSDGDCVGNVSRN